MRALRAMDAGVHKSALVAVNPAPALRCVV